MVRGRRRSQMGSLRRVVGGVAVLGVLVGCGVELGGGSTKWGSEQLSGTPAVDFPTVLAAEGDDALVLMLSDDGVLQSHHSRDGAGFEEGVPLRTGHEYVGLGGAVRLPDGDWFSLGSGGLTTVEGDGRLLFEPLGFRSKDGLRWDEVEIQGLSGPADINGLVAVEGGVVAVGAYRTAKDPSMGGHRAAAWLSADGRQFTEVSLPGVGSGESYVGHVTVSGKRLLAGGRAGERGALWTSSDSGRTWVASDDAAVRGAYALSGLASEGVVVVATIAEDATHLLRSTDSGKTWTTVSAPAGGEGWAPLWWAGGRFLTVAGGSSDAWARPEVCYADLDQCGDAPEAGLFASDDGSAWTRVDTSSIGEIDQIVGTADGRTLALARGSDGSSLHTWPGGTDLPAADQPDPPKTVELVTLAEGEQPAVGVRYHQPLYAHCGMDWLWIGDTTWRRTDDGPDLESGAGDRAPDGWPVVGETIYGFATLADETTVEYSIPGGQVIATYERAGGAPGCM